MTVSSCPHPWHSVFFVRALRRPWQHLFVVKVKRDVHAARRRRGRQQWQQSGNLCSVKWWRQLPSRMGNIAFLCRLHFWAMRSGFFFFLFFDEIRFCWRSEDFGVSSMCIWCRNDHFAEKLYSYCTRLYAATQRRSFSDNNNEREQKKIFCVSPACEASNAHTVYQMSRRNPPELKMRTEKVKRNVSVCDPYWLEKLCFNLIFFSFYFSATHASLQLRTQLQ